MIVDWAVLVLTCWWVDVWGSVVVRAMTGVGGGMMVVMGVAISVKSSGLYVSAVGGFPVG